MTEIIGWPTTPVACSIKQGSNGTIRFALVVTKADGSPLDSYAGWTSVLPLFRRPQLDPEMTLTPAVVADAANHRFIVDVAFSTAQTKTVEPGDLQGDLCLIEPGGVERHFPVDLTLTVERSFAQVP